MYENWYWGAYPMVAASTGANNSWGYLIKPNSPSTWTWNVNHWYLMTINYKMSNSADDYIDWYIDGVQQTNYRQARYTAINPISSASGNAFSFGCLEPYYSVSPARFDNIQITSEVPNPALTPGPSTVVYSDDVIMDGNLSDPAWNYATWVPMNYAYDEYPFPYDTAGDYVGGPIQAANVAYLWGAGGTQDLLRC